MVDKALDDFPGTETAIFAIEDGLEVNAASCPNSLSLKVGMIDMLYQLTNASEEE